MKQVISAISALVVVALAWPANPAKAQDNLRPILYVEEHQIEGDRIDSLRTMVAKYVIPWHDFVATKVEGYQRWHFTHDTGDAANYIVMTMYPDWDYVRGDEIPWSAIWEEYKTTNGITQEQVDANQPAWNYIFEGATHTDNIYRPIVADQD